MDDDATPGQPATQPPHDEDPDQPTDYAVLECPNCGYPATTATPAGHSDATCPECSHTADVDQYTVLLETTDPFEAKRRRDEHATTATPQEAALEPHGDVASDTVASGRLRDGPDYEARISDQPRLSDDWPVDPDPTGITVRPTLWFPPDDAITISDVPPQRQEWIQPTLRDLTPIAARLIRDIAVETASSPFGGQRLSLFVTDVLEKTIVPVDESASTTVNAEVRTYLEALTRYAFLFNDPEYLAGRTVWGDEYIENVERTLERVGTSLGQFNAGIDAFRRGPLAILAQADTQPTIIFDLDTDQWTDATEDTIRRSLETFHTLSGVADVTLQASVETASHIADLVAAADGGDTSAEWAANLTITDDSSTDTPSLEREPESNQDVTADDAFHVLSEEVKAGQLLILQHLHEDAARTVKELKADDNIDKSNGTIDRYIPELESLSLIETETVTTGSNKVWLTALGAEAKSLITPDNTIVHPSQSRLSEGGYGNLPAARKFSVNSQPDKRGPVEAQLAATGDPRDAGWVQWLGNSAASRRLEPSTMQDRILAGRRVDGVNLVENEILDWTDDDQAPDGDGRVTYISAFDGDVVLTTQWGGAAATLARFTSALLSNPAWSKMLTTDRLGEEFEEAFDGVGTFQQDLSDVLQRGVQVGWLSEDELEDKDEWKDRVTTVRNEILEKLGRFEELDNGLRSKWFRDLHGLLLSTIAMYRAAGLHVNFNLRLPNAHELARDEDRLEEFLTFIQKTVTKQAGFRDGNGLHSIYRLLIEDRPPKLRSRLPYDGQPDGESAEMMASWIIEGYGVESLQGEIEAAVADERNRVRQRVQDGTEAAPNLQVPIVSASTKMNTRRLVREYSTLKDFPGADVDSLTRVLNAYLRDENRDRGPVPGDVADVMMALESSDKEGDKLTPESLGVGLATVPDRKLLPDLPPSATRMLKALLRSGDSLTRSELEDVTSERSVQRHLKTLTATALVEDAGNHGYIAFVEPWWATDATEPHKEEHRDVYRDSWAPHSVDRWPEAVSQVFFDVPGVYESTLQHVTGGRLFTHPVKPGVVKRALPQFGWFVDFARLLMDAPPPDTDEGRRVVIGPTPARRAPGQAALAGGTLE
jgi:hypothetical protein